MAPAPESWTILKILRWTTDYFTTKGVSEPRTSAEVLLAHSLGLTRLDLYLRYDQPLNQEELARFKALVLRRAQGEPVAYLTGHREFWSLDFHVTSAVLIPRPETETLVAAALEAAKDFKPDKKITPLEAHPGTQNPEPETPTFWGLEIGVGSGAIVITLARELPYTAWVAVDLSAAALAVAQDNASRLGVADRIRFLRGDLLAGLRPESRFALLAANLPYVPRAEWERLPRDIKDFEPRQALWGGEDGLSLIRVLVRQAHEYLMKGGWVLLEVGDGQAPQVATLLQQTEAYDRVETIKDFNGIERVVRARRSDGAG
ncbi:MAG: peptide chain release factor N(5)-glutamine methyltransferase [Syntrophobacterales bacterium]|jgi:release factor glutamine methyltransferase|nr:peptide chain release factor N(5)-glutamine methyltransferase [Syntrophobacterales bacterium]